MASVFHLCWDATNIKQKVVTKYADLSESDKKLYFAAVTIQKTWRGYLARKMIEDWNKKATIIQKYVRGWLVRIHLPEILKAHYYDLSVKYYNDQAAKIQALWRGYRTRKNFLSIKGLRAERLEIELASKEMQDLIRKLFEALRAGPWSQTYQSLKGILTILFNRHHLLRTRQQEGIFSIHGSYELSCIEKVLKSFRFTEYMDELRSLSQGQGVLFDEPKMKEKFDLNTYLKDKPYERMLLTQD